MIKKHDPTRIYVVTDPEGHERLVRTSHRSYAMNYISRQTYKVRVANQRDLERLLPDIAVEVYNPRPHKSADLAA